MVALRRGSRTRISTTPPKTLPLPTSNDTGWLVPCKKETNIELWHNRRLHEDMLAELRLKGVLPSYVEVNTFAQCNFNDKDHFHVVKILGISSASEGFAATNQAALEGKRGRPIFTTEVLACAAKVNKYAHAQRTDMAGVLIQYKSGGGVDIIPFDEVAERLRPYNMHNPLPAVTWWQKKKKQHRDLLVRWGRTTSATVLSLLFFLVLMATCLDLSTVECFASRTVHAVHGMHPDPVAQPCLATMCAIPPPSLITSSVDPRSLAYRTCLFQHLLAEPPPLPLSLTPAPTSLEPPPPPCDTAALSECLAINHPVSPYHSCVATLATLVYVFEVLVVSNTVFLYRPPKRGNRRKKKKKNAKKKTAREVKVKMGRPQRIKTKLLGATIDDYTHLHTCTGSTTSVLRPPAPSFHIYDPTEPWAQHGYKEECTFVVNALEAIASQYRVNNGGNGVSHFGNDDDGFDVALRVAREDDTAIIGFRTRPVGKGQRIPKHPVLMQRQRSAKSQSAKKHFSNIPAMYSAHDAGNNTFKPLIHELVYDENHRLYKMMFTMDALIKKKHPDFHKHVMRIIPCEYRIFSKLCFTQIAKVLYYSC